MPQINPAMMQTLVPMMVQQMQQMGVLGNYRGGCKGGGGGGGGGGGKGQTPKPGDWICPQCQDLQFARNSECRLCSAPRPTEGDENFEASRVRSRSPRGRAAAGADNSQMPIADGVGW